MTIEPDGKDWTWVLERRCDECGFDVKTVSGTELSGHVLASAGAWVERLTVRDDARRRPDPRTWSPLEYACHVRDVHRIMTERLHRMLDEDDPGFENWDQDATAEQERYGEQDPQVVSSELVEAARAGAELLVGIRGDQWRRPGRRSDGFPFTVESLGRYWLHDVEHHLHDVGPPA
jgi:hypothetical protein